MAYAGVNGHELMMQLGIVTFGITAGAYDKIKRRNTWNYGKLVRLGHPIAKRLGIGGPALQYISTSTETLQISGTIYPFVQSFALGDDEFLSANDPGKDLILPSDPMLPLRLQSGTGMPMPLISIGGSLFGFWVVGQIEETHSVFFKDGTARKIEFEMTLERYTEVELSAFNWI